MQPASTQPGHFAWRLQDAKAQFSEVVNNALRGVPQHVTKHGKRAVVVVSEQEFDALQCGAARGVSKRAAAPANLVEHLLAMPKGAKAKTQTKSSTGTPARLTLEPRDVAFS